MKILITGATGFIGKRLTKELLREGHEVYALVRPQSLFKAKDIFPHEENFHLVIGNLSNKKIISEKFAGGESLPQDIEAVVHLGAIYDLEVGVIDAYLHNVVGTQNLISLMQEMRHLKYFHHMSTYAVSGISNGEFTEDDLNLGASFSDEYSRSKMQAEHLVRNATLANVQIRIYRPGIVVGDSRSGAIDKIDGPYYFLRLFYHLSKININLLLSYLPLCCHIQSQLPLLPVDVLTSWMNHMIKHPSEGKLKSYHLIPDEKILITDFTNEALKVMDLSLKIKHLPYPKLYAKLLPYFGIPKQLVPYMQMETSYSQEQFKNDFPQLKSPGFRDYLPNLIRGSEKLM